MNTYVRIRVISFYKIYVYVTKSYVFTCILRATTSKVIRRDRLTVETTYECLSRDRRSGKTLFVRRSIRYVITLYRCTVSDIRDGLTFDGLTVSLLDVSTRAGVGFAAVLLLLVLSARLTHPHTTPRTHHTTPAPAFNTVLRTYRNTTKLS